MLSRIKFEIDALVNEMLDQLPVHVWTSDSTTFFDPAIGGGQFVKEIECRLLRYGHSKANVRKRVFGLEESNLHIRYAVNKHKLVGQYACKPYEKFLELDSSVKFDVIVGNPPFQNSNSDAKRWTLWEQFVNKAFELSDNVAMVTPQSITSPGPFSLIKDKSLIINIDVSKHFNVGSTFCYFVADKNKPAGTTTKIVTNETVFDQDVSKLPFLPFVINQETLSQLAWLMNRKSRSWKRGEFHTSNKQLFNANGKYTVMHTNAQELRSNADHPNRDKIRVAISLSGYPKFKVVQGSYVSQACFWTEFDTVEKAQDFADECNGDYIQSIMTVFKWSGWNSKEVIQCL